MAVAPLVALRTLGAQVVPAFSMAARTEVVTRLSEGAGARLTVAWHLAGGISVVTGSTALTVSSHCMVCTFLTVKPEYLNTIIFHNCCM